jgi:hypothetical protein
MNTIPVFVAWVGIVIAAAVISMVLAERGNTIEAPLTEPPPQITTVQMQDNVRCYVLDAGPSARNPRTMDCVQLWMPEELQQ